MNRRSRGMAMIISMLVVVFLSPVVLLLLRRAIVLDKHNMLSRHMAAARGLADKPIVDMLRQFSQNPYAAYGDAGALARPETFYEVGYSSVAITSHPLGRSLFLRAFGKYGTDEANPQHTRGVEAVVKFVTEMTRFNVFTPGLNFAISAVDSTRVGPEVYRSLTVSGANVRWIGGPVVVYNDCSLRADSKIDGDLYVGGNLSPSNLTEGSPTSNVTGHIYHFAPPVLDNPIDLDYYRLAATFSIDDKNETWVFKVADPSASPLQGQFDRYDAMGNYIGTENLGVDNVLLAENSVLTLKVDCHSGAKDEETLACNDTLYTVQAGNMGASPVTVVNPPNGGVHGRVTIVCTAGTLIGSGNVNIIDRFQYFSSTHTASVGESLAILASGQIYLNKKNRFDGVSGVVGDDANPLNITGFLYSQQGATDNYSGVQIDNTPTLYLRGGRNCQFWGYTLSSTFIFDPQLSANPPPGLPARPYLVRYRSTGRR